MGSLQLSITGVRDAAQSSTELMLRLASQNRHLLPAQAAFFSSLFNECLRCVTSLSIQGHRASEGTACVHWKKQTKKPSSTHAGLVMGHYCSSWKCASVSSTARQIGKSFNVSVYVSPVYRPRQLLEHPCRQISRRMLIHARLLPPPPFPFLPPTV